MLDVKSSFSPHAVHHAFANHTRLALHNNIFFTLKIFLRELISNASDALDKIRLLSLTNDDALAGNEELTIKIKVC